MGTEDGGGGVVWTTLAGAARATGRASTTIAAWAHASEAAAEVMRQARADLFSASEVTHEGEGGGARWRFHLTALARVHRARGGVYWQPDAALPIAALPPAVSEELSRLRRRVASLEAQLAQVTQVTQARQTASEYSANGIIRSDTLGDGKEDVKDADGALAAQARPSAQPTLPAASARRVLQRADGVDLQSAPPLPEGWIAVSTWANRRQVHGQRFSDLLARGRLPQPQEGVWRHGGNIIRRAWSHAQQAAADAVYREEAPRRQRETRHDQGDDQGDDQGAADA